MPVEKKRLNNPLQMEKDSLLFTTSEQSPYRVKIESFSNNLSYIYKPIGACGNYLSDQIKTGEIPMSNKEWTSGEECHIDGYGVALYTFGCDCPNPAGTCIVFTESGGGHMVVLKEKLAKPKLEDDKRNDSGYSLFSNSRALQVKLSFGLIQTWDQLTPEAVEFWCAFAEKLGHKAD